MEESSYDGSTNRSHFCFLSVLCVYLLNFYFFLQVWRKTAPMGIQKVSCWLSIPVFMLLLTQYALEHLCHRMNFQVTALPQKLSQVWLTFAQEFCSPHSSSAAGKCYHHFTEMEDGLIGLDKATFKGIWMPK